MGVTRKNAAAVTVDSPGHQENQSKPTKTEDGNKSYHFSSLLEAIIAAKYPHKLSKFRSKPSPAYKLSYQLSLKEEDRDPKLNALFNKPDVTFLDLVLYQLDGQKLSSLLTTPGRDFLVRTDDCSNKVPVASLMGKKVGLYFSSFSQPESEKFSRILADFLDELSGKGDFKIVVSPPVSATSFDGVISTMPWLAVPISDAEALRHLSKLFIACKRPALVILDERGEILTYDGVEIIQEYGVEAYPFTQERLTEMKQQAEAAKQNQSLQSILATKSHEFVVSNGGGKVNISELEGKTVALYFSKGSSDFTTKLKKVYGDLRERGESFEIVMILLEDEEEPFMHEIEGVPWLSLPFKDTSRYRLQSYFEVSAIPSVVVIGPDGRTLHSNVVDAVKEYGALAYPFTVQKFSELEAIEKATQEAQTLESLFVSGNHHGFVIRKDGFKVPVSSLAGKHVLLYFASRPRLYLTVELAETFESIKQEDDAFEVISIVDDDNEFLFDKHFSKMSSWLALPFGDERKQSLSRVFKDAPMVVAFGPTGKFITAKALEFIQLFGAAAYPFTANRIEMLEEKYAEAAKTWPAPRYICEWCGKERKERSLKCQVCKGNFHLECVLDDTKHASVA